MLLLRQHVGSNDRLVFSPVALVDNGHRVCLLNNLFDFLLDNLLDRNFLDHFLFFLAGGKTCGEANGCECHHQMLNLFHFHLI